MSASLFLLKVINVLADVIILSHEFLLEQFFFCLISILRGKNGEVLVQLMNLTI